MTEMLSVKVAVPLMALTVLAIYEPWEEMKPYCETYIHRCSAYREDHHSLDYYSSKCYCDLFCSTHGNDCCPDFEYICKIALPVPSLLPLHRNANIDGDRLFEHQRPSDVEPRARVFKDNRNELRRWANASRAKNQLPTEIQLFPGAKTNGHEHAGKTYKQLNARKIARPDDRRSQHDDRWSELGGRKSQHGDMVSRRKFTQDGSKSEQYEPKYHYVDPASNHDDRGSRNARFFNHGYDFLAIEQNFQYSAADSPQGMANEMSLIAKINNSTRGWRAVEYRRWGRIKLKNLMWKLFGNWTNEEYVEGISRLPLYEHDPSIHGFLPSARWDARQNSGWTIGGIRDQRGCPISWIISAVDVAADRFAMISNIENIWQRVDDPFSIQQVLSCSRAAGSHEIRRSCHAVKGSVMRSWNFLKRYGTLTERCYPFIVSASQNSTIPPCQLSRATLKRFAYSLGLGSQYVRMKCPSSHQLPPMNGNSGGYRAVTYDAGRTHSMVFKPGPPYRVSSNVKDIQYELVLRGPVQTTMLVCPDFLYYRKGVYRTFTRPESELAGCRYHSVRIIGWGHIRDRSGTRSPYWICANSWGRFWGESGYFRIRFNDSEINQWVVTTFGQSEYYY